MSTWTGRSPERPLRCRSQGDSGPPGQRKARGCRSTPGGAWDKRAHTFAASERVPPGGSQRSVSTAVPAMLLLARITSAVEAGAVAGRLEPAPQPATVSAAAITAMIATVRFCPMLVKTAAPHGKFPVSSLPTSRPPVHNGAAHAEGLRMADKRLRRSRRDLTLAPRQAVKAAAPEQSSRVPPSAALPSAPPRAARDRSHSWSAPSARPALGSC